MVSKDLAIRNVVSVYTEFLILVRPLSGPDSQPKLSVVASKDSCDVVPVACRCPRLMLFVSGACHETH